MKSNNDNENKNNYDKKIVIPVKKKRNNKKNFSIYIIILIGIVVLSFYLFKDDSAPKEKEVNFSELVNLFKEDKIKTVKIVDVKLEAKTISLKEQKALKKAKKEDKTKTLVYYFPTYYDAEHDFIVSKYVIPLSNAGKLEYLTEKPKGESMFITLLPTIMTAILLGVFIFIMLSGALTGGGKGVMNFGKTKARLNQQSQDRISFSDVAGLKEEKEELMEVVDFLRFPKKYTDLGARIPKGLLLVGPPGTGKTYISRATAGEAGVPFFTISGSDFVEMFVGVGASRVRSLFDEAKKKSPCIIFIDEIDAVGRRRGAGLGGGHDEREQTLNQLLVEMDGFGRNSGIIILAATNRPDILDPALLRAGRFDRQIVIGTPDIKGREEIFLVHSKNKILAPGVNEKVLAKRTPGFTPADIENMLNEAALLTARRNGRKIRMEDIEEAITKVIAGPEKKSRVISDEERKLTAYHEAGHAIIMRAIPILDPVHQVTIIPRGFAGGFTMSLPNEDKFYETKGKMKAEIISLLGGRIAEKLVLNDISTGASNDIARATAIAKDMVTKYGFSEKVGPINYHEEQEVFLGRDFNNHTSISEETSSLIDEEIKKIIEDAFKEGEKILRNKKDVLELVANALLEIETLDSDQFEELYSKKITLKQLVKKVETEDSKIKKMNEIEAKETKKILDEEHKKKMLEIAQNEKSEVIKINKKDTKNSNSKKKK